MFKFLFINAVIAVLVCAALLMADDETRNDKPRYGNLGLPSNCRALIAANLEGVASGQYTKEEALFSISRNCGANGTLWSK